MSEVKEVKVGNASFDAATIVDLVSRVNAVEQNVGQIRKDVELVQSEVRDVATAELEVECPYVITEDERCLIHMYRFLLEHGEGAPKMRILVRSDGFMTMGHQGE